MAFQRDWDDSSEMKESTVLSASAYWKKRMTQIQVYTTPSYHDDKDADLGLYFRFQQLKQTINSIKSALFQQFFHLFFFFSSSSAETA